MKYIDKFLKFIDNFFSNKRAIALSMRFLVIIILSIVVLGFGIKYSSRLFQKGTDISKVSMDQIEKSLGQIKCEEDALSCLNQDNMKIRVGKYGVFALKITNYLPSTNFSINVSFDSAYRNNKTSINCNNHYMNDDTKWLKYIKDEIPIKKGESKERSFIIAPQKYVDYLEDGTVYTEPGKYIYNVEIQYLNGTNWLEYDKHKIMIKVD